MSKRLTDTSDDELMWANYGAGHTGFVIAHKADDLRACDSENGYRTDLLPVLYDDRPFDAEELLQWARLKSVGANIISSDVLADLKAAFRKGMKYESEQEWRARILISGLSWVEEIADILQNL